ncbi:MAG: hypothetical protein JAZ17_09525 [Candidatus Thiodiazotropha endolucinida]|nr:hypothetical protein [Candidatus Thiodiazotropha endolucinida]
MICNINKTSPTDLQETLLFAIKDVSMLLSMATSADYGNEKLLAPEFISSIANDIGTLAEIVLNIDC